MTNQQLFLTNVSLEDLIERVADRIILKLGKTTELDLPQQPQEDILFKSIKEAAAYYGCCYQTLSKEMSRITHIPIGRTIKVYKSEIEKAIQKYGILSKKKR